MKHLSNIYDHRLPEARTYFTNSNHAMFEGEKAIDHEWQQHLNWINQNVIGKPKATEKYTVKELEDLGYIDIYSDTYICCSCEKKYNYDSTELSIVDGSVKCIHCQTE